MLAISSCCIIATATLTWYWKRRKGLQGLESPEHPKTLLEEGDNETESLASAQLDVDPIVEEVDSDHPDNEIEMWRKSQNMLLVVDDDLRVLVWSLGLSRVGVGMPWGEGVCQMGGSDILEVHDMRDRVHTHHICWSTIRA